MEQDRWERARLGKLHHTLYDWKQCLELQQRVEDLYDLVSDILVSRGHGRRRREHTDFRWVSQLDWASVDR